MAQFNITIYQGAQYTLKYTAEAVNDDPNAAAIPYDLTDKGVRGKIKPTADSCKEFAFQTFITDELAGKITLYIPATVTATMAPGQYVYDVEIYTIGNEAEVDRALFGTVTVTHEVTKQ